METKSLHDIGRLLIACPDRPGIVAAISQFLFTHHCNITESSQHSTNPSGGAFFIRMAFHLPDLKLHESTLRAAFQPIAKRFRMKWRLAHAVPFKRLAVFVSKADHALLELLMRVRAGDLQAEIAMVVSNHPDLADTAATWGIAFHHISVADKPSAERKQLALVREGIDTIVLARYMQILSPTFLSRCPCPVINIHHSFLPAFVGANPYAQAYARGVKLTGATAHYVTADLDAGPIIVQDVQPVDHRHNIESLKQTGRYIERVVLAQAVALHVEDRVLVYDDPESASHRTIVFK